MSSNILPRLLTTEQASAYLSIPVDTLAHWRFRQKGPAFVRVNKLNRTTGKTPARNVVRYDVQTLDAWIAANLEGGQT